MSYHTDVPAFCKSKHTKTQINVIVKVVSWFYFLCWKYKSVEGINHIREGELPPNQESFDGKLPEIH